MTLNIGGGFSLARCASSRVSSLCCAMPPFGPILIKPGGGMQCDKRSTGTRITAFFQALDEPGRGAVKGRQCLDTGCLLANRGGGAWFRHGSGTKKRPVAEINN